MSIVVDYPSANSTTEKVNKAGVDVLTDEQNFFFFPRIGSDINGVVVHQDWAGNVRNIFNTDVTVEKNYKRVL